jgi:hypothetical protein
VTPVDVYRLGSAIKGRELLGCSGTHAGEQGW